MLRDMMSLIRAMKICWPDRAKQLFTLSTQYLDFAVKEDDSQYLQGERHLAAGHLLVVELLAVHTFELDQVVGHMTVVALHTLQVVDHMVLERAARIPMLVVVVGRKWLVADHMLEL